MSGRANASPLSDVVDDLIKVVLDVLLQDADDMPAAFAERTVPSRVRPSPIFVVGPIHFHDEADLGGSEVDDPVSVDQLPAEREVGLRPPQRPAAWAPRVEARSA